MLANLSDSFQLGTLNRDVHKTGAFFYAIVEFIADALPQWRDDTDRPPATSETTLTFQLSNYLTSVARHSAGFDIVHFSTEAPDERHAGRKIDLVPVPSGNTIWIEGRRYTKFDLLLPIECKRLPTPEGTKTKPRDEREYVFSQYSSTGGIQRFKAGHHGSAHQLGAMIAYVQQGTAAIWHDSVTQWVGDLANAGQPGWTLGDALHLERDDETQRIAVFRSTHTRGNGLQDIELRHLWLKMN